MIIRLLSYVFFISLMLPACKEKKLVIASFTGFTQGTTYSIVFDNNKNIDPEILKSNTEKILDDFDMSLSLYQDSSVLSKVNRNENVVVDPYFEEVFRKSVEISELTKGAFDVTVGPLVKAWGFGPDSHKNFETEKLDSLLKLVGMSKISLVNGNLVKSDPGIMLDFNAIAQGFAVDIICRYFDSQGIKNYLIEIGGEVRGKGTKGGALWRIGIDRPEDGNNIPGMKLQAIIKIGDKALATSGNYRKFYIEDGLKYSHTIDPRTGYPAKNRLLSATIIADECSVADGVATACMVMGLENAIDFITNHSEYRGYLVFSDDDGNFKTWISENLKDFISETGDE